MRNQLRSWAGKALPIDPRLVAVGIVLGLAAGAFWVDESVDMAKAVGIAVCISVSVGSWLGLRLYLVTARFFISWIDAIRKQVASLEPGLMPAECPVSTCDRQNPHRPPARHIVLISVYATPIGFVMVTTGAIGSILSTQLGSLFVAALFTATLSSLSALVLVVAIQSWYLWRVQRQVASFQRRLPQVQPILPDTLPTEILNRNISRTARIVRRLTGISQTATEQATA